MNKANASRAEVVFRPGTHLLNNIRFMRMSVGDGLNDHELTRLLRETVLPTEAGFAFLSLSEALHRHARHSRRLGGFGTAAAMAGSAGGPIGLV